MAVTATATLIPLNDQYVQVQGLAMAGTPTTGATVTVTLVDEKGLPVAGIESLPLTDVVGQPGNYQGVIAATFTAAPGNYSLQITAVSGGSHYYNEQPCTVPFFAVNNVVPVDALCTVDAVMQYYTISTGQGTNNSSLKPLIQRVINRFTAYAKNECNRPAFLTQSYTEVFNGNGGYMICPKYVFPTNELQSVTSLTINGQTIPAATTDGKSNGYIFDGSTVYLRGYYTYLRGIQNVVLTYTAGLASIPQELEFAAVEAVAYWLKRREYIGQASVSVNGQTVVFSKDDVPQSVRNVLDQYTRRR